MNVRSASNSPPPLSRRNVTLSLQRGLAKRIDRETVMPETGTESPRSHGNSIMENAAEPNYFNVGVDACGELLNPTSFSNPVYWW